MAAQWPDEARYRALSQAVQGAGRAVRYSIARNLAGYDDGLRDVADSVAGQLRSQVTQSVEDLRRTSSAASSRLLQELWGRLDSLREDVTSGAVDLAAHLAAGLMDVSGGVNAVGSSVLDNLRGAVSSIAPDLTGLLRYLVEGIAWGVTTLLDSLADTDELIQVVTAALRERGSEIAAWLANALAGGVGVGLLSGLSGLEVELPRGITQLLEEIEAADGFPPGLRGLSQWGRPGSAPISGALVVPVIIAILAAVAAAIAGPAVESAQQKARAAVPNVLPDAGDVTDAFARGLIGWEEWRDAMERHGLGGTWPEVLYNVTRQRASVAALVTLRLWGWLDADGYVAAMHELGFDRYQAALTLEGSRHVLTDGEIRDAYLRGLVDEAEHDRLVVASGLRPEQARLRRALYQVIPPPTDIIRMAVREAFDDEQARLLDLDANLPEAFLYWAERVGLSREWAQRYWRAHWELPSPTQAFEMLHRGLITEAELSALLQAADYAPRWRPLLQAIAYAPLTRVDVRRMYAMGVLDDDGVERAYRELGYSPENARRLLAFTRRMSQKESEDALAPWRATLKTRIVSAYVNGVLSEDETAFALADLGYTDAEADAFLAEGRLIRETERAADMREAIRQRFVRGIDEWPETEELMRRAGFEEEEIAFVRPVWEMQRQLRLPTEEELAERDLSKAEVLAARSERLITEQEAERMLRQLGYDEREAATLLALQETRDQRAAQSALRDAVRARYQRGSITLAEASAELDRLGLRAEQRDALLAKWEAEYIRAGDKVPLSTIRALLAAGYITDDRARELLAAHGYPRDVLAGIIALWRTGRRTEG